MDETRTAPHRAATRPQEALPDDAFELVGAGWREHRPALRRPGWRQRLARLPLLPLCLLLLLVLGCLCAPWLANHDPAEFYLADRNTPPGSRFFFGTDSLGRDIYSIIWFGGRASLLLAVAAVNFKADQTLVGTAMNLLGTAAATVFVKAMNTAADPDNVSSTIQYLDGRKAFLVNIGGFEFNWCMLLAVIALVIAYVVLYKTRFGLRLCACGEHPQAADSVGINVYRMRYAGVLISGVLGGLGGIVYIIAGVSEWKFENGVAGFGFLALAVMIFGQWKPTRIALAALLFGFFRALGNVYSGFDLLSNLNLPSSVYNMLPYVISLVVLAFTSQKSRAPKAEGIPYDKGQR